jgi:uncharacterized DUF497 family protein
MAELRCEWDPRKAAQNLRKHGVSFSEAETVFTDEGGLLIDDPGHSKDEDRYLLLGLGAGLRLLVVAHSYRSSGTVIRIISAWKATRSERRQYIDR